MRFTKMHGAGNDYVYINAFKETMPENLAELAIKISDRHRGVGGDGMILICPSEVADARMRMFNADGSESEMCGNGVRCVAKYVHDYGIATKPQLRIETGRGVLKLDLNVSGGKVQTVRVNMGQPIMEAERIPTLLTGNPPVLVSLNAGEKTFPVTVVSMGNPHCVTYVDKLSDDWVLRTGPLVEHHPMFPRRVNAEFVEVISNNEVRMRVWERGSGETQACGTGACAVCVAGVLTGKTGRIITVHLPGGDLQLEWLESTGEVLMTGPAEEVFSGDWV